MKEQFFFIVETAAQGSNGNDSYMEWERYDRLWVAVNRAKVIRSQGVTVRVSRCVALQLDKINDVFDDK